MPDETIKNVDWQGLDAATETAPFEKSGPKGKKARLEKAAQPKADELGENKDNRGKDADYIDRVNQKAQEDPSQPLGNSDHSPKPDARDDTKVERLRAPDWRGTQPLPGAQGAIDPRGENTPQETFEEKDYDAK